MPQIEQQFTIHPVGQGLFYSGKISLDGNVIFRMVFDCGSNGNSTRAGKEEVENYRNTGSFLADKKLDLLVISHFDQDHVNHIGQLLADEVKVTKLVMPFVTFQERLFLVARYLDENNGNDDGGDYFIRFTLDPLGTISNNLDSDSEVLIISGADGDSIPEQNLTQNENYSNTGQDASVGGNQERFGFDFNPTDKEGFGGGDELFLTSEIGQISQVSHRNIGFVQAKSGIKLMDFLFYRRNIGDNENEFYKIVKEEFYKEFKIKEEELPKKKLENIIEVVKNIHSATKIKEIFKKAKKANEGDLIKGIKIDDLNTTALCLLHRNLRGLFSLAGFPRDWDWNRILCGNIRSKCSAINVFRYKNGVYPPKRIENKLTWPYCSFKDLNDWPKPNINGFNFPNTFLTSDSYLLEKGQVDAFLCHYENYFECFWLFQIPHHGSKYNSNQILYENIHYPWCNFINYGVYNGHRHPSPEVIDNLVAKGNSTRLILVNEYSGFEFTLHINYP